MFLFLLTVVLVTLAIFVITNDDLPRLVHELSPWILGVAGGLIVYQCPMMVFVIIWEGLNLCREPCPVDDSLE